MWGNLLVVVLVLGYCRAELNDETAGQNGEKETQEGYKLIILTVATEDNDGFKRFVRSAVQYDLKVMVLGMGTEWRGGDTRYYTGGGQKIRLIRSALEEFKDDKKLIVMFSDAYDVVLNALESDIISRFLSFNARVVFSAEPYCWPDRTLAVKYPLVKVGKRYLNSGLFMGFVSDIFGIVSESEITDGDDDQLYYTNIFLDEVLREKYHIRLDTTSRIFQNLNGAQDDVELEFPTPERAVLRNMAYNTRPAVVHGNGNSKDMLNWLGNYVGNAWNQIDGCVHCWENVITFSGVEPSEYPIVTLAILLNEPTAFFEQFLQHISKLDYPRDRMHLFFYSDTTYHSKQINTFLDENEVSYLSSYVVLPDDNVPQDHARNGAVEYCLKQSCDYLFVVEAEAHITNDQTLKILIQQNRGVIAPLLGRPGKLWSNFWGALTESGYYARSDDYLQIVQRDRIGLWNVPFVRTSYLISGPLLPKLKTAYTQNDKIDADMSFCEILRTDGVFIYVDNFAEFGHLIDSEEFDKTKKYPDLFQIFDNEQDWNARYLHPNLTKVLAGEIEIGQPCPDVYDFPYFSERFCNEFIEEVEHFGQWSSGTNEDERLEGGYENVPTRDIHMNQFGFERHWLYILNTYAREIQEKVFTGYFQNPIHSNMMFVVRYKPDEQPFLRPHHDASTYSVDIALNRRGTDFQGGGVRFVRYNCTVLDHKLGHSLIFPGRLTHLHEGLHTTEGTRYIAVSFINP